MPIRAIVEVFGINENMEEMNCSLKVYMKISVQKWLKATCLQAQADKNFEGAFRVGDLQFSES